MPTFDPSKFTAPTAKPLPVILLLDVSGSMGGAKIQNLNDAVKDMLGTFRDTENSEIEIHVAIITFGAEVRLHQALASASEITWHDLNASGMTPLGTALKMAKAMIEDKDVVPSRAYRPTVVLVSDGQPNDAWEQPLEDFIKDGRSAKCDRMALAIGAGLALTKLGIEPTTPVELVALSERARSLLRRKQIDSVGRLLEFLDQEGPSRLREYKGVGESTASELVGLLKAIQTGCPDLVRKYLPIRKSGAGLSLSTAAGRLLDELAKEDREALFIHFGQGETLRATGKQSGRTGGRVSQVTSGLLKGLDEVLVHFPDEKQSLWEAWERCEPLQGLLDEDLDEAAKQTVAGAIGRLFESSAEGRAIRQHRKELFSRWWKDVRAAPEFYLGGIRVPQFVRGKGEPYLLMSFLEYLEARSGVAVSRSSGKAWPTKLPLKRFVNAVIETSADRMTLLQLHERVIQVEFFENLQLTDLEKKICRWEESGFIPAGRMRSE